MQLSRILTLTALVMAFAVQGSLAHAQETIRLSVATSLMEAIFSRIKEPFEKETGIKLVLRNEGKGTEIYFKELLEGQADGAAASVSYNDWLKIMERFKIAIPADANITHRVIGYDLMVAIAHQDAGVAKLSAEQVTDLLTGAAKTWKAVGGKDVPVTLYFSNDKPNRRTGVQRNFLKNKEYTTNNKTLDTEVNMFKEMAKDPGALAIVATLAQGDKLRKIETPQLGRPATLITKGRPSPAMDKLITFIRNNQNLIANQ